jgi:hypothetical protein
VEELERSGVAHDRINVLFPGASEEQVHSVPTSASEQPGLGAAIGGVVGGALGVAGGLQLGTAAAASIMIPGVGPVVAVGLAAATLLGAGGAITGAALGSAAERKTTQGLPADEVFFYEDALRQGRSLIVVMAEEKAGAECARDVLTAAGAESLDAARDAWWIGLRDAEKEHYRTSGGDFERDHEVYRSGFEAALRPENRGLSYAQALDRLRTEQGEAAASQPFRHGYERGRDHLDRCTGVKAS